MRQVGVAPSGRAVALVVLVGYGTLPFPRLFKLGLQHLSRGAVAHDTVASGGGEILLSGSWAVRFDSERRCVLGSDSCRNHRHHVVIRISEVTLGDMV